MVGVGTIPSPGSRKSLPGLNLLWRIYTNCTIQLDTWCQSRPTSATDLGKRRFRALFSVSSKPNLPVDIVYTKHNMRLTKGKIFVFVGIVGLGLWYIIESSKSGIGFFGPFPLILLAIVVAVIGSIIDKPKFQAVSSKSSFSRVIGVIGILLFVGIMALVIWGIFKGYS